MGAQYSKHQPERAIALWKSSDEPAALERWIRTSYAHCDRRELQNELDRLRGLELPVSNRVFIEDFYS